jgi:hypothetical protein
MLHSTERSLTLTGIFHATEHDPEANFELRLNLYGRCHFTVYDGKTGKVTGNIEFRDKEIRGKVSVAISVLGPEVEFPIVPGTGVHMFRHTEGQSALEALFVCLHEIADEANWTEIARTQKLRSEETFNFLVETANHRLEMLECCIGGVTIAVRFEREEALKAIANLLPKSETLTIPFGPMYPLRKQERDELDAYLRTPTLHPPRSLRS